MQRGVRRSMATLEFSASTAWAQLVAAGTGLRFAKIPSARFAHRHHCCVACLYLGALEAGLFALKRPPIELPMLQLPISTVTLKNRTLSPMAQLS
jgi:hypothetical protein